MVCFNSGAVKFIKQSEMERTLNVLDMPEIKYLIILSETILIEHIT